MISIRRAFSVMSLKQLKVLCIVFSGIVGCLLLVSCGSWGIMKYQQSTWSLETATVVDYDVSQPDNVWTEISYVYQQKLYTEK